MTISLHFHTLNLGADLRDGKNPFTGETSSFPIDNGLSETERRSVVALLDSIGASTPDPDGYCYVELSDGARVGVGAPTLKTDDKCIAFHVECNVISEDAAAFMFSLSLAGNMAIGSSVNPDIVALTNDPKNPGILKRWPKATVLDNIHSLRIWIEKTCT